MGRFVNLKGSVCVWVDDLMDVVWVVYRVGLVGYGFHIVRVSVKTYSPSGNWTSHLASIPKLPRIFY